MRWTVDEGEGGCVALHELLKINRSWNGNGFTQDCFMRLVASILEVIWFQRNQTLYKSKSSDPIESIAKIRDRLSEIETVVMNGKVVILCFVVLLGLMRYKRKQYLLSIYPGMIFENLGVNQTSEFGI